MVTFGMGSGGRIKGVLVGALCALAILPANLTSASPVTVLCFTEAKTSSDATRSRDGLCRYKKRGVVEVTEQAGLGRIEFGPGKIGAVLQRDEGIVSILDMSRPERPKVVGTYDGGNDESLDGDLAFSDDGKWLFYSRQTPDFSFEGLHVLDVSDPSSPQLVSYGAAGGAFRVDYHRDGDEEYIVMLDAITGLVVYRFESTTGQVVPVHVDALPALKVGGPASAGIYIDRKDPQLGHPVLYVTTGRTGLEVYDFSDPAAPELLGEWTDVGLAEVEVSATKSSRTVYAASEYWFDKSLPPEVVVLDATDLTKIVESHRLSVRAPADDLWRVQGMTLSGRYLHVAYSHLGLVTFDRSSSGVMGVAALAGVRNEGARVLGSPYAMDVEVRSGLVYLSDAATGTIAALKHTRY
jgi:hypothetical protein